MSHSDPYAAAMASPVAMQASPPVPPHPMQQLSNGSPLTTKQAGSYSAAPFAVQDYGHSSRGSAGAARAASSRASAGSCLAGLIAVVLVGVIALLIVQVVFSSLSYSQLQSNGSRLSGLDAAGGCSCPSAGVTTGELSSAIGGLLSVYAPNADAAVIRGIQLPDPANYTAVFDFNAPHSTDLITPFGYAKVANIENYPASHNQAMSQTLFQLEVDGSNSPHHHPDAVEILFVFQGSIEVTRVEPNNGRTYTDVLHPNMSVIFPRGHIHF